MKMRIFRCFVILLLIPTGVFAENSVVCSPQNRFDPLDTVTASAATWTNFRNGEDSLRFQAAKLLGSAISKLPGASRPEDLCDAECLVAQFPEIVLTAIPQKLLADYDDREKCQRLLESTKIQPFRFKDKTFTSLEALTDWFSDFSAGRGPDGKTLYAQCDGLCSPQYKLFVSKRPDTTLSLNAEVICGHARDKNDNHYTLSQGFLWSCEPASFVHDQRARARNTST